MSRVLIYPRPSHALPPPGSVSVARGTFAEASEPTRVCGLQDESPSVVCLLWVRTGGQWHAPTITVSYGTDHRPAACPRSVPPPPSSPCRKLRCPGGLAVFGYVGVGGGRLIRGRFGSEEAEAP